MATPILIGSLGYRSANAPIRRACRATHPVPAAGGGVDFVTVNDQGSQHEITCQGDFATVPNVEALIGTSVEVAGFGMSGTCIVIDARNVSCQVIDNAGAPRWWVVSSFSLYTVSAA